MTTRCHQFRYGIVTIGLIAWLGLSGAPASGQTQPWTDPAWQPPEGLVLWLDARRLAAAYEARGLEPLEDGDPLPLWPDGSRHGRDMRQHDSESQPRVIHVGDDRVVRFDGENDHLRYEAPGTPPPLSALTAFVVAAPHRNPGEFRGLVSSNAAGRRDYESGFNVDLGPGPTAAWEVVNVEGPGFGGARNLLRDAGPLARLHVIEIRIDPDRREVAVYRDGKPQGTRPLEPNSLSFEQFTVGARFYTNGPGPQQARGWLAGDLAEILVFDRALGDEPTRRVRDYLRSKHARLADELPKHIEAHTVGKPLVKVPDPPAVQMLVPGFSVAELPLSLTNINNVRFREDGALVALGYNGDLHLLTDSDGDGLEDTSRLFWKNEGSVRGPIGMVLTPPGYAKGRGAFVPSKGKVSLIVDTDGDDRADREIVVASGWNEIPQTVDAVGIALDRDGAIYFGLGTANYANAYLVDEHGNASYDRRSDRGTVQKVSPDFSRRETVCTGVRFPIAFAFNRAGDLFCTEQEGATWLANGNPLDELLHIQPGRHYGFPPRHPRYNPDVIDEPSTFDFGPQHQSTCGMVFNEPVHRGGPVFGPGDWAGDAIVCGESRGKIWRTKLVPTRHGYVADARLVACLQMLTVDACVAPDGDLVVACHSGPPHWGTGPLGIGKLFRIRMTRPDAPRPVIAWSESPHEVRIALDRPVDPRQAQNLLERIAIQYGASVRAGDQLENLIPPYAVVQRQLLEPRRALPVRGVSLTNDLRTLIINTDRMRTADHFAVRLPWPDGEGAPPSARPQLPEIELDYTLNGVAARWQPAGGQGIDQTAAGGWLPHLDLGVARAVAGRSAGHDSLWEAFERPGRLILETQLDLHHILRPALQPGSTIDYTWPPEEVTVRLLSSVPFEAASGERTFAAARAGREFSVDIATSGDAPQWLPLRLAVPTGQETSPLDLSVAVFTSEDATLRPLPLRRFWLPWAARSHDAAALEPAPPVAELEGGDWGRGRRVYHSEAAACFKCHAIGGIGAAIGPDLANLVHRDYASVLRDLVHPSYAINPDYLGHTVLLNDGRTLTGVLRTDGPRLVLGDAQGNTTPIPPEDIERMQPASTSVMPTGLIEKLTVDQRRDLMTFLLTEPPRMPDDSPLKAPPVRTQAELAGVLAGAPEPPAAWRPLRVVLVAGAKDHGPGEHDYPAWQRMWGQLLSGAANVHVSQAADFPDDETLKGADIVVFYQKGTWNDERQAQMDRYFQRGGGAVYIHWAVNGDERVDGFSQRIGLASRGGNIRYRHGPLSLDIHSTDHPIMRNIERLELYDESYWLLTGEPSGVTLLASSVEDGQARPQIWTYERGRGRVFVSIPGHYSWTFDDPIFRAILLRGMAWTAREPVDRFNDLVPWGARLAR